MKDIQYESRATLPTLPTTKYHKPREETKVAKSRAAATFSGEPPSSREIERDLFCANFRGERIKSRTFSSIEMPGKGTFPSPSPQSFIGKREKEQMSIFFFFPLFRYWQHRWNGEKCLHHASMWALQPTYFFLLSFFRETEGRGVSVGIIPPPRISRCFSSSSSSSSAHHLPKEGFSSPPSFDAEDMKRHSKREEEEGRAADRNELYLGTPREDFFLGWKMCQHAVSVCSSLFGASHSSFQVSRFHVLVWALGWGWGLPGFSPLLVWKKALQRVSHSNPYTQSRVLNTVEARSDVRYVARALRKKNIKTFFARAYAEEKCVFFCIFRSCHSCTYGSILDSVTHCCVAGLAGPRLINCLHTQVGRKKGSSPHTPGPITLREKKEKQYMWAWRRIFFPWRPRCIVLGVEVGLLPRRIAGSPNAFYPFFTRKEEEDGG